MSKRRNPKLVISALIVSSVIAASYKLYEYVKREETSVYTKKSIALTLSHSILNSSLPLKEILLNSENVTFILPPNLSIEDLNNIIEDSINLVNNYKLLNCSNFKGYVNIIKNLRPDMLLVCSDDLGKSQLPMDLERFVKEIVDIGQNEDVVKKVSRIFIK